MRKTAILIAVALATAISAQAESWHDKAPAPRSVECVAVFELMDRAAPNWTRQVSVQSAWQSWQGEAVRLSSRAQVDFGTQISREMTSLADQLTLDPNVLSRRALQCVADAPVA